MSYEIKLKRTTKNSTDATIKDLVLKSGEPIYFSSNNWLGIGDGSTIIGNIKGVKLVPQSIVSNGIYYSSKDSDSNVTPVDSSANTIYVKTRTSSVYNDDGTSDLTTILSNKEPAFTTLPTTKGGTGINSLPQNSVPMGGANNTGVAIPVDQSISDVTTNHLASVSAIANLINSKLESAHLAGSSSAGGPASTAVSSEDTTDTTVYVTGVTAPNGALKYNTNIYMNCSTGVLMGAAWNDFAECRDCHERPGTCVAENGDGTMSKSSDYVQPGCSIVSDTYGMLIGSEEYKNGSAIAVAGRVLAYFDDSKGKAKAGCAVGSAPNGKVALMTRDEIKEYPDAILGYISEIPTYDEWNEKKVNGRIWIKVK